MRPPLVNAGHLATSKYSTPDDNQFSRHALELSRASVHITTKRKISHLHSSVIIGQKPYLHPKCVSQDVNPYKTDPISQACYYSELESALLASLIIAGSASLVYQLCIMVIIYIL